MPEQFTVPQFIDIEDKILGPLSVRQFLILLAVGLIDTLLFKLASFVTFLGIGIPLLGIGITFAFIRINGQPFHFFILNMIQTFRKPQLRVWDKAMTDAELKPYLKQAAVVTLAPAPTRAPVTRSRLAELSLIVNTGGGYQGENENK